MSNCIQRSNRGSRGARQPLVNLQQPFLLLILRMCCLDSLIIHPISVPAEIPVLDMPSTLVNRLDIPGLRDAVVEEYKAWQQSQVKCEIQKVEFEKTCDTALEEGLDLEQIHKDQDYKFFMDKGVKRGIARRFVDDIEK